MKPFFLRRLLLLGIFAILLCTAGCAEKKTVAPPKNLLANVSPEKTVELSWSPSEDAELYRVYRIEGNNVDFRFLCDTTELGYSDKTTKSNVIYGYKVTALLGNTESEGCISEKLTISSEYGKTVETPNTPTITSVTNLDRYTTVILFDAENENCIYRVMRAESENGPFTLIGETDEKAYYDKTLTDGESYYYTVTATNEQTSSDASEAEKTGMNALDVFSVPVLMYHQFLTPEDVNEGVNFGEYAVWLSDFEADLEWIRKNGYTTITTKDLISYMEGEKKPPEKPIILTIDDGYRGVYLNAWPLLEKYDMKAVFAVIGSKINEADLQDKDDSHADRLYCNWDELAQMEQSGTIEIISHTVTLHNDEEKRDERYGANCAEGESEDAFYVAALPDYLAVSQKFKTHFGYNAYAMAYPYSSRSEVSDNVWTKCGYRILYGGNSNSVRKDARNFLATGAGITRDCDVLRRVARMNGTPIWKYAKDYYR